MSESLKNKGSKGMALNQSISFAGCRYIFSKTGLYSDLTEAPYYRFIFMEKGEGEYSFSGEKVKLNRGDLIFVQPGMRTIDYPKDQEVMSRIVLFEADSPFIQTPFIKFPYRNRDYHFLKELFYEIYLGSKQRKQFLTELLLELFLEKKEKVEQYDHRIEKAVELIKNGLGQNLSIENLAREVALSSVHFRRLFKQETAKTPKEFIIEERMTYARFLLEEERLPAKEVAYILSYSSLQEFSKRFKLHFGFPPSQSK